jgi:tRNA A37 N6-isopentenylltransferase MiaA
LNKRLDDRVEQMMKNGLLNEIESFKTDFDLKFPKYVRQFCLFTQLKNLLINLYSNFQSQSFKEYSRDYQFGIFQSIGFKEFENFFKCNTESEKQHLIEEGLKEMKLSTRRYAKYQIRWINNRFIKSNFLFFY